MNCRVKLDSYARFMLEKTTVTCAMLRGNIKDTLFCMKSRLFELHPSHVELSSFLTVGLQGAMPLRLFIWSFCTRLITQFIEVLT